MTEGGSAKVNEGAIGPRPVCEISLCPIFAAVIAVGEMQPELVEHVLAASRELLLALRGLIDARLSDVQPTSSVQRLTIT